jgi:hypothetical protein
MSDQTPPNEDLADEFQALGKNLVDAMRAAWNSPERKRLQQEIEGGLQELEYTLKREVDAFSKSSTGQQIKEDVNRISEKINTKQTPELIRQELIKALQTANVELQNIIQRWASEEPEAEAASDTSPEEGPQ